VAVDLPNTCEKLLSREGFEGLVQRANGGDQVAIQDLRSILQNRPELVDHLANITSHALLALIRAIAGTNQLVHASLEMKMEQLQTELLGPNPSTLERLLVGRVVVSYLETEYLTAKYAADGTGNLATAKFAVQAKLAAQRRFESAVKSLMLVRERLPAIERANRELRRDRKKVIRLPARASA
jgi:hypothetical protein